MGYNRPWKTRIYSLGIELSDDEVSFMEDVFGLKNTDYRNIERYIMLPRTRR